MGLTEEIRDLRADCVSIDSKTPIHALMAALPGRKIMGNIKAAAFSGNSPLDVRRGFAGARCIVPLLKENLPALSRRRAGLRERQGCPLSGRQGYLSGYL